MAPIPLSHFRPPRKTRLISAYQDRQDRAAEKEIGRPGDLSRQICVAAHFCLDEPRRTARRWRALLAQSSDLGSH
jgi:hypothetical protein